MWAIRSKVRDSDGKVQLDSETHLHRYDASLCPAWYDVRVFQRINTFIFQSSRCKNSFGRKPVCLPPDVDALGWVVMMQGTLPWWECLWCWMTLSSIRIRRGNTSLRCPPPRIGRGNTYLRCTPSVPDEFTAVFSLRHHICIVQCNISLKFCFALLMVHSTLWNWWPFSVVESVVYPESNCFNNINGIPRDRNNFPFQIRFRLKKGLNTLK